jgi:hypothetical protein
MLLIIGPRLHLVNDVLLQVVEVDHAFFLKGGKRLLTASLDKTRTIGFL